MRKIIGYIFISFVFFSCCKEEEPHKPVHAGVYDSEFIYHEFENPLEIKLKTDTVLNIKTGADSIDINLDGSFDLFIKQRFFLDYDGNDKYKFDDDNFPYCFFSLKNTLEVAVRTETAPAGHGDIYQTHWADTLKLNARIDEIDCWKNKNRIYMWAVPPVSYYLSGGCWYNIFSGEKYVGIRMKTGSRYKYGWIKIDQMARNKIKFISYAIEK